MDKREREREEQNIRGSQGYVVAIFTEEHLRN